MNIDLFQLAPIGDDRGKLIALESQMNIPFEIKRIYYIFDTIPNVIRGKHAHRKLKQILICISGSCTILLDDGISREEISLDTPSKGLMISSLTWREMYNFSPGAVLLVLASEHYDESDYIRDYNQFLITCGEKA